MNKFKFSNYKLPHMSKSAVAYHKKGHMVKKDDMIKAEKPTIKATSREKEIAKFSPKPLQKPKPLAPDPAPKQTVSSSGGGDLDEFLKRVESRKITNPEYADTEGPKYSRGYDFFITNRNEESDKVARQMDSLNKTVMDQASKRQFAEMKKTRAYQQKLKDQYNLD